MKSTGVTLTAKPPLHAPDGSRGYYLDVDNDQYANGWIYAGDDGRVYATLNSAPWAHVGTVAAATELTPDWITDHTLEILRPF